VRILVTGARGFLGSVLVKQAHEAGWAVSSLDMDLYMRSGPTPSRSDFQDLQADELQGYDAIVHLAGISSDAACDLRSDAAARVNGSAAAELAQRAKEAGVPRFIFASSCSVYGAAPNRISNEKSECTPISSYALAKQRAESGILAGTSTTFAPTVLRFATLYGLSPSLRIDLVVNAMVSSAWRSGEIALNGTGEQSRPLVHVQDAASTVLDLLKAGEDEVRGQIFNVTDQSTGYSVAHIAEVVRKAVPGSRIVQNPGGKDLRHYLADGTRLHRLCARQPRLLDAGVAEVAAGFRCMDWQRRAAAPESNRAERLRHLLERGKLTDDLRWRD
jgi:nucleoside-diphosphate-sugar epimerase